jgi:hypothetical protein
MQELTKRVGAELIVSKTVEALIVEHFELQPLGQFALHNLPGSWEVFAISEPIAAPRERSPHSLPQNAAKET